jgi:hypothetical protein
MIGSDYAATPAASMSDSGPLAANVIRSGLAENELSLVLRENARHLFSVQP